MGSWMVTSFKPTRLHHSCCSTIDILAFH